MNFPISIDRTSLFQILGVLGGIFHFIQILIERSVSKQWRRWSDWSGSALFADAHRLIWVNCLSKDLCTVKNLQETFDWYVLITIKLWKESVGVLWSPPSLRPSDGCTSVRYVMSSHSGHICGPLTCSHIAMKQISLFPCSYFLAFFYNIVFVIPPPNLTLFLGYFEINAHFPLFPKAPKRTSNSVDGRRAVCLIIAFCQVLIIIHILLKIKTPP